MNGKLSALFRRRSPAAAPAPAYDTQTLRPVILCSICTGEQTAGFQDIHSGRFTAVALIRTPQDLDAFRREYKIQGDIKKIY